LESRTPRRATCARHSPSPYGLMEAMRKFWGIVTQNYAFPRINSP
jgi:hypothetical protein